MFDLDAPRHARWRAASPRCARWRSVQWGSRISRLINIYNGKPPSHLEFATARKVWGYASITTTHTSIAFLQRRRIPSIRINHNFKQPQIHNATAHIINHPQHSSHWQFQWKNHTLPLKMLKIPLYTQKSLKNAQHFALFEHRPKKIKKGSHPGSNLRQKIHFELDSTHSPRHPEPKWLRSKRGVKLGRVKKAYFWVSRSL